MYSRTYENITSLTLLHVLNELKPDLTGLINDNPELLFKYEFILEELLTNSFTHITQMDSVNVQIKLQLELSRIEYREIGATAIEFTQLLLSGQKIAENPSLEKFGGLGLHLINQMVRKFTCNYDDHFRILTFTVFV